MKNMKRRDFVSVLFICFTVACLMTACMNSSSAPVPETQTESQTRTTPAASETPAVTEAPAYDWVKNSAEVEDRLKMISELSDARVIVSGNTALVAVRFSGAYQGGMTSRIREMIAGEVMKADPSIKTVGVTGENEDVVRVYTLSDRLRSGSPVDTLKNDIAEIIRNATTLT